MDARESVELDGMCLAALMQSGAVPATLAGGLEREMPRRKRGSDLMRRLR